MKPAPRFPWRSGVAMALALLGLVGVGDLFSSHCAFGFGGVGCTDPLVGRGDLLLTIMAGLALATGVLLMVFAFLLFRWAWGRWNHPSRKGPNGPASNAPRAKGRGGRQDRSPRKE